MPRLGKEPWKYAAYVQPAMKEFLKLRNKLIPYLYTMNHLTHTKGMPLIMPMYYMHGDDAAYYVPNEYYFGEDIIKQKRYDCILINGEFQILPEDHDDELPSFVYHVEAYTAEEACKLAKREYEEDILHAKGMAYYDCY